MTILACRVLTYATDCMECLDTHTRTHTHTHTHTTRERADATCWYKYIYYSTPYCVEERGLGWCKPTRYSDPLPGGRFGGRTPVGVRDFFVFNTHPDWS